MCCDNSSLVREPLQEPAAPSAIKCHSQVMTTWVLLLFIALLGTSARGTGLIEKGKQLAVSWYNKVLENLPKFAIRSFLSRILNVDNNVFFILYRRNCQPQKLVLGDLESLTNSCLNPNVETKILIHGWLSAENNHFSELMKQAYLQAHDYNVIAVDWSWYSYNFYSFARFSIDYVAPHISKFVEFILQAGINPGDIHILGHSLGAHIAGLAGQKMSFNVSRITGMDPAMPLIFGDSSHRLDATDAQFVDIIHTSKYTLGIYMPYGHADFFPNGGGPLQPGCGLEIGVCTHSRSYRYFIESIQNEKGFMAIRCDSWRHFTHQNCSNEYAYMGEKVSHLARGQFYLRTATKPPYALGDIVWESGNKDGYTNLQHNTPSEAGSSVPARLRSNLTPPIDYMQYDPDSTFPENYNHKIITKT